MEDTQPCSSEHEQVLPRWAPVLAKYSASFVFSIRSEYDVMDMLELQELQETKCEILFPTEAAPLLLVPALRCNTPQEIQVKQVLSDVRSAH